MSVSFLLSWRDTTPTIMMMKKQSVMVWWKRPKTQQWGGEVLSKSCCDNLNFWGPHLFFIHPPSPSNGMGDDDNPCHTSGCIFNEWLLQLLQSNLGFGRIFLLLLQVTVKRQKVPSISLEKEVCGLSMIPQRLNLGKLLQSLKSRECKLCYIVVDTRIDVHKKSESSSLSVSQDQELFIYYKLCKRKTSESSLGSLL